MACAKVAANRYKYIASSSESFFSNELLWLKMRYKKCQRLAFITTLFK